MKVFRNILCCVYIGATLCSAAFFANMLEFPLNVGGGSWFYALVLMFFFEEPGLLGLLGFVWFAAFWVLLLIAAILAYKGKFTLLCVFSAIDALVTLTCLTVRGIADNWTVEPTFLVDGIITLVITAALITATVLCRKKVLRTDVDEFLLEQRRNAS